MNAILDLHPETYQRHFVHSRERSWAETNCYVDVWIELLHGWGFEPRAALPFTIAIDFEGDQWTFFKFGLADLRELYGLDVQELAIWLPLIQHVEEQIQRGRPVLVELDSYYLPDTVGTAYRMAHVKSTVAAVKIDRTNRRLGYFHGQSYYELHGDDFANIFRLNVDPAQIPPESALLPPYVEFVKRRNGGKLQGRSLVGKSLAILQAQLNSLPEANPFQSYKARFASDMTWLAEAPLEVFHQYSFATLRQFGACYELAATYFEWLKENDVPHCDAAIAGFTALSTSAKTLQFQLARAMARKRPLEMTVLDGMAAKWAETVEHLKTHFHEPTSGP